MNKLILNRSVPPWQVIAVGINCIIGTSIFFLPKRISALLGPASIIAFVVAAILCLLLALCFAEVGSRFSQSGGPMLYCHTAFGWRAGALVGWVTWINRVIAWAALSSSLTRAAKPLWAHIEESRSLVLSANFLLLAAINIRGVRLTSRLNVATVCFKFIPFLALFIAGFSSIRFENMVPFAPNSYGALGEATLLAFFSFTGFEAVAIPAGEYQTAQRSVANGILGALAIVFVIYLLVWIVCVGSLPQLNTVDNPFAVVISIAWGAIAGPLVAIGMLFSVTGTVVASSLITSRSLYALGEQGILPNYIATVHSRNKTPWVAVVVSSLCAWLLTLFGTFESLAAISVVARFAQYIPTCLALVKFRIDEKKRAGITEYKSATFIVPGGLFIAFISIVVCLWVASHASRLQLVVGMCAMLSGVPLLARQRLLTR